MYLTAKKTLNLRGEIIPPSSKSQSIRGMIFSLLAKGESTLLNILNSDDTEVAMHICEALGAKLHATQNTLIIKSKGLPLTTSAIKINTKNSGITTLFTLPLLGLRENCAIPIYFNCGEQMRARPIKSLVNALRNLGMHIHYIEHEGQLPILVTGQLNGGIAEVDGMNSQYLSALLISLPCALNDSVITIKNLHERPYVNMTLTYLKQYGIDYSHQFIDNVDTFHIRGNQRYIPLHNTIKGDFSSASCLIAASALIPSEVELQGLDYEDSQGDKKLISILREMGAEIAIMPEKIRIKGSKPLTGIRIDARDIPDLVPALAVIATQATGKTEIYNVIQARIKETDRIHSMTEGLRKMGAKIEEHQDGMTIDQSHLQGAFVNGYGDHRTVMALTVAGMLASGTTTITDGEAINKTYPKFVEAMQAIGANVTWNHSTSNHIILLIHGVNLNALGKRDPAHYGTLTLKDIEDITAQEAEKYGFHIISYQSNHEGDLVDQLQSEASHCVGIIINPGAFTHYSYALHDALLDTNLPVIEVHLSNPSQREIWRKKSVIAPACIKVIEGKKEQGYREAVSALAEYLQP